MKVIKDTEISFFRNESDDYITSYFNDIANLISDKHNILYISYTYSKNVLLSKYNYLNRDNITIVYNPASNFNNIDDYIIENKVEYVLIDHLNLTKTKRTFYVNGMKLKDLRYIIEEYENKYGVKFIVVINHRDGDDKSDK